MNDTLTERCSCGATIILTGFAPTNSAQAQTWRETHRHDMSSMSKEPEPELNYVDCTCGHPYDDHDAEGCSPACGCSHPGPAPAQENWRNDAARALGLREDPA